MEKGGQQLRIDISERDIWGFTFANRKIEDGILAEKNFFADTTFANRIFTNGLLWMVIFEDKSTGKFYSILLYKQFLKNESKKFDLSTSYSHFKKILKKIRLFKVFFLTWPSEKFDLQMFYHQLSRPQMSTHNWWIIMEKI